MGEDIVFYQTCNKYHIEYEREESSTYRRQIKTADFSFL
jgi:hypothetical protein